MSTIDKFIPHAEIACSLTEYDESIHKTFYRHNYPAIFRAIAKGELEHRETIRQLIKTDRFFIVHFIMGIEKANHPFVVQMCQMIEEGPDDGTVDVWAREHYKSVAITIAGTVQRIVNNPDSTTAIFSYKKPAAEKFLEAIRGILEDPAMVWAFPEILWDKTPTSQWSLQGGIRVKRENNARKEHTVEAFGLIEGMPTGGHWDHRIYDDVETADLAMNPDQLQLCFERFEMSRNLGTEGGTEQVIGTYYSHCGFLVKLDDKRTIHGEKMYLLRVVPATDDGKITGKPVLFSQAYLDSKKTDSTFNTQQLCNPSPLHDIKLRWDFFRPIDPNELPKDRLKFVIIDPAGDKDVQSGAKNDSWAIMCVSVNPYMDELGNSDVYLEDLTTGEMSLSTAIDAACNMYIRNGRIAMLAVEKVANDTTYEHIRKALIARGKFIEIKKSKRYGGNMMLLSPMGRTKNYRIESALSWPLNNGKLHYSTDLDIDSISKLQEECNKFPFYHVDILDALAYVYDILKEDTFIFSLDSDEDETYNFKEDNTGRSSFCGY